MEFDLNSKSFLKLCNEKLDSFNSKIEIMELKDIDELFAHIKLVIEITGEVKTLETGGKYNEDDPDIAEAKENLVNLMEKMQYCCDKLNNHKNNCTNFNKIAQQKFTNKQEKYRAGMGKNPNQKYMNMCNEYMNRILKEVINFTEKSQVVIEIVGKYNKEVNDTIHSIHDAFTLMKEKLEKKKQDEKYKSYAQISKDLSLINTQPKECVKRSERLNTFDEDKLYDISGIAKAAEAQPEEWLTESEKELCKKMCVVLVCV